VPQLRRPVPRRAGSAPIADSRPVDARALVAFRLCRRRQPAPVETAPRWAAPAPPPAAPSSRRHGRGPCAATRPDSPQPQVMASSPRVMASSPRIRQQPQGLRPAPRLRPAPGLRPPQGYGYAPPVAAAQQRPSSWASGDWLVLVILAGAFIVVRQRSKASSSRVPRSLGWCGRPVRIPRPSRPRLRSAQPTPATRTPVLSPQPVDGNGSRVFHCNLLDDGTVLIAEATTIRGIWPQPRLRSQTGRSAPRDMPPLAMPHRHVAAGRHRLITGGSNGDLHLTSAEIYDPKAGHFSATGSMNRISRIPTGHAATDGRVLVPEARLRSTGWAAVFCEV